MAKVLLKNVVSLPEMTLERENGAKLMKETRIKVVMTLKRCLKRIQMKMMNLKLKEKEVSQETTEEMEMAKVEEEGKPGETKSQMSQGQVKGPTSQLLWTCLFTGSTMRHQEIKLFHT